MCAHMPSAYYYACTDILQSCTHMYTHTKYGQSLFKAHVVYEYNNKLLLVSVPTPFKSIIQNLNHNYYPTSIRLILIAQ